MTTFPHLNQSHPEPFRVFVTSLAKPYTASCTGFHPHPFAAFDAAADFRIYPPFWVGCVVEAPQQRTMKATQRWVRDAFDRFIDRLTNNNHDRIATRLRAPRLKISPPDVPSVGGAKKELYYLFVEVE